MRRIVDAIRLLAETEGIFTEPAGGTTLAATISLVKQGVIKPMSLRWSASLATATKTAEVVAGKKSRFSSAAPSKTSSVVDLATVSRHALKRVRVHCAPRTRGLTPGPRSA